MSDSFEVSFTSDTESEDESETTVKIPEKKPPEEPKASEEINGTTETVTLNGDTTEVSADFTFTFSVEESSSTNQTISSKDEETVTIKTDNAISDSSSTLKDATDAKDTAIKETTAVNDATHAKETTNVKEITDLKEGTETIQSQKYDKAVAQEVHIETQDTPAEATKTAPKENGDVLIDPKAEEKIQGLAKERAIANDRAGEVSITLRATNLMSESNQSSNQSADKHFSISQVNTAETIATRDAKKTTTSFEVKESTSSISTEEVSGLIAQGGKISAQSKVDSQERKDYYLSEEKNLKISPDNLVPGGENKLGAITTDDVRMEEKENKRKPIKIQMEPSHRQEFSQAENLPSDYEQSSRTSRRTELDETRQVKSVEKTTMVLAGDEESTEDLIKRILAEAGADIKLSAATRERYKFDSSERGAATDVPPSQTRQPDHVTAPTNEPPPMAAGSDPMKEPSLLERRLASIEKEQVEMRGSSFSPKAQASSGDYHMRSLQEEEYSYEETTRGGRASATTRSDHMEATKRSSREAAAERSDSYEANQLGRSAATGFTDYDAGMITQAASTQHSRQQKSGLLQKQHHVAEHEDYDRFGAASQRVLGGRRSYDVYDEYEDEEDEAYARRRRQMLEEALPDEDFIPVKGCDTDKVVQERTEDIRKVVENQDAVLKRLKSASDSFDDLDSEIRQIREQFIESQMRRSMILDDLEYEKMYSEQLEREQDMGAPRRAVGSRGSVVGASDNFDYDYDEMDYSSKKSQYATTSKKYGSSGLYRSGNAAGDEYDVYSPSVTRRAQTERRYELDQELDNDVITRGSLAGLALRGDTQRYKTAYDEIDSRRAYGADRSSRFDMTDDYTPIATKKRGRSLSMFEQDDLDFDSGIPRSSYRSDIQRRRAGGFVSAADDDEVPSASSYRTPNLPSYRKYDFNSSSMATGSKSASKFSSYGGDDGSDTGSSISSSRAGRLGRAQTLDYGVSATSSYRSAAMGGRYGLSNSKPSFNSRFLNKVREKKAGGEDIKRDKPFSSRFLAKSFDSPSSSGFSSTRSSAKDTDKSAAESKESNE